MELKTFQICIFFMWLFLIISSCKNNNTKNELNRNVLKDTVVVKNTIEYANNYSFLELEEPLIPFFKNSYCGKDNKNIFLSLTFRQKDDKIYVFYENVFGKAGYIIDNKSNKDYYTYFSIESIQNNSISFKLRNTRYGFSHYDDYEYYNVILKFNKEKETIIWSVSNENVFYVPKKIELSTC